MNINDIRVSRIKHLMAQDAKNEEMQGRRAKKMDFAIKAGITQQSLSAICSNNKPVGTRVARRMEEKLGLRDGYLDTPLMNMTFETQTEADYAEEFIKYVRANDYNFARVFLDAMRASGGIERAKLYVLFDLFHKNLK